MSRRIALSVAASVVVLAGAGASVFAYAADQPTPPALAHSTAHYTAVGPHAGSLAFSTDVTASSGVKSVKTLAWPENSSLTTQPPTAHDMAQVESATCKPAGSKTTHCTYTLPPAAATRPMPHGVWHIAVLATAKDGTTTLNTKAAGFTVK